MSHCLYNLHLINNLVESIKIDLTDKKDKTAQVLKSIKEIQKNIIELRNNYNIEKENERDAQDGYFDNVLFEFSEDNQFEKSITRSLNGYLIDMVDIQSWIKAERRLSDKNGQYLHARVILTDYDSEDLPDNMKLED